MSIATLLQLGHSYRYRLAQEIHVRAFEQFFDVGHGLVSGTAWTSVFN